MIVLYAKVIGIAYRQYRHWVHTFFYEYRLTMWRGGTNYNIVVYTHGLEVDENRHGRVHSTSVIGKKYL